MEMTENRIEVLKAILACCSQSLYEDLMINPSFTNPWILLFSAYEIRYSKDTFFSLLNTALNYNYEGYSLFTDESLYETEASLSIQVLNVFLDSKIPEKVEKDEELD